MDYFLLALLGVIGVLMMFVILLQRGRGGGLAGAFGGLGGQSAFGTKAGDVFTRITVVLAVVWVVLAGVTGLSMRAASEGKSGTRYPGGEQVVPEEPEASARPGATFPPSEPADDPGTKDDGPQLPENRDE